MTRLEWLLCISLSVIFIVASLLDQYSYGWQDDLYPLEAVVTIILGWGWLENERRKNLPKL